MRFLYRCLLRLHPASFRDQFAGEMLWIFDQTANSGLAVAFLADGFASLARQWVLRAGAWKVAAGSFSSFVLICGMMSMAAFPTHHSPTPDFSDADFSVTAASGPSTQFAGHWAGNILFPGPANCKCAAPMAAPIPAGPKTSRSALTPYRFALRQIMAT